MIAGAMTMRVFVLAVVVCGVGAGLASVPQAAAANASPIATVTFTMSSPNGNPQYYSVAVTSMGSVSYRSTPNSDLRTGEPYMLDFHSSRATRTHIFRLVKRLNFFRGALKTRDSARVGISTKTLTFSEGPLDNQIVYTSSKSAPIDQLTAIFERISATMEFGRRLARLRSRNPGMLRAELKQMERQSRLGQLAELPAVSPVLETLASDGRIPETSRRYAREILKNTHS